MDYKKIELTMTEPCQFMNGLKFEIATARSEKCKVLRVDIVEDAEIKSEKFFSVIECELVKMKQRRLIQFFAFPENFLQGGTESRFLINKYPDFVGEGSKEDDSLYLYISL